MVFPWMSGWRISRHSSRARAGAARKGAATRTDRRRALRMAAVRMFVRLLGRGEDKPPVPAGSTTSPGGVRFPPEVRGGAGSVPGEAGAGQDAAGIVGFAAGRAGGDDVLEQRRRLGGA